MTAVSVSLTVNGKPVSETDEARTLLVQLLRENLRLTGTHVGCDTSQCGACVVHVDGRSVKSCTLLAVQAEGAKVSLDEAGAETVLRYGVQGQVGGKLAQIGSRLIDATSRKMADDFFNRFLGVVSGSSEATTAS